MFFLSLNRSLKFAWQSFFRNIWLSLATIFIIFLTFMSINFLVALNAVSASAISAVKDKIDVSLYFKQEVRESKVAEVKSQLEAISAVKEVIYSSAEQNLANFKALHEQDTVIQESLNELSGNPLGATLVIRAKKLTDYPEILSAIDGPAYSDLIEKKSYDDNQPVIEKINIISDSIRKGGLIVSLIFVIIAALIVFNTVRIALFTHRSEISIMKLVGASNWFVRSPFILETVFAGVIGCLVAIVVMYGILSLIQPHLVTFFGGANFDLVGYFNHNLLWIAGGELLGIIALTIISSSLALGKYLNV